MLDCTVLILQLVELESALLKLRNPHLDNVQELLEYYDKMVGIF